MYPSLFIQLTYGWEADTTMLSVIFNITELLHTMEVLMRSNRCKVIAIYGGRQEDSCTGVSFQLWRNLWPWPGWLSWLSVLCTKQLPVWFPARAHTLVMGLISGRSAYPKNKTIFKNLWILGKPSWFFQGFEHSTGPPKMESNSTFGKKPQSWISSLWPLENPSRWVSPLKKTSVGSKSFPPCSCLGSSWSKQWPMHSPEQLLPPPTLFLQVKLPSRLSPLGKQTAPCQVLYHHSPVPAWPLPNSSKPCTLTTES